MPPTQPTSGSITLSPSLAPLPSLFTSPSMASPSIPTSTSTSATSTSSVHLAALLTKGYSLLLYTKNTRDEEDEQHVALKVVLPRAQAGIRRAGGTPIIHARSYEASAHASALLPFPNTPRRGWRFMSCDLGVEFVRVLGRRRYDAFCAAWMWWIRIHGRLEGCGALAAPIDFSTPNPPHCDLGTLSSHHVNSSSPSRPRP
ncbi:hypothetical protein K438DRAFT_1984647 [Mycena galopus ATCC 62051]|nr:hypothetical protein K438DRAFT_1984647 [Mycena galopus ATCC 62051]